MLLHVDEVFHHSIVGGKNGVSHTVAARLTDTNATIEFKRLASIFVAWFAMLSYIIVAWFAMLSYIRIDGHALN